MTNKADDPRQPTRQAISDAMVLHGFKAFNAEQWQAIEQHVDLRRVLPHHAKQAMDSLPWDRRPKPVQVVNLMLRRPWEQPAPGKDPDRPGPFYRDLRPAFDALPETVRKSLLEWASADEPLGVLLVRFGGVDPSAPHDPNERRCHCIDCEIVGARRGMSLYPQLRIMHACFLMHHMGEDGKLQSLVDAARADEASESAEPTPTRPDLSQNVTEPDALTSSGADEEPDGAEKVDVSGWF